MKNIKFGFRAYCNICNLLVIFLIPGSGILLYWFYMDRKRFKNVLVGNIWLIEYIKELRKRYATREE